MFLILDEFHKINKISVKNHLKRYAVTAAKIKVNLPRHIP